MVRHSHVTCMVPKIKSSFVPVESVSHVFNEIGSRISQDNGLLCILPAGEKRGPKIGPWPISRSASEIARVTSPLSKIGRAKIGCLDERCTPLSELA